MELRDSINSLTQDLNALIEVPFRDNQFNLPIYAFRKNGDRLQGFLVTQVLTQTEIDNLPPKLQDLFLRFSGVENVVFIVDLDYSDSDNLEMTYTAAVLEEPENASAEPTLLDYYERMLTTLEAA